MTRRAAEAVAMVALLGACSAAPNPSTNPARDSTVVARIVRERLTAGFAGDTARWHRPVSDDCLRTERLSGRYAFGTLDRLTVAPASRGRFTLRGMDGSTDTLLAENDSTLFEEGDPGSWVFSTAASREPRALVYQMAGAKDVVLPRAKRS